MLTGYDTHFHKPIPVSVTQQAMAAILHIEKEAKKNEHNEALKKSREESIVTDTNIIRKRVLEKIKNEPGVRYRVLFSYASRRHGIVKKVLGELVSKGSIIAKRDNRGVIKFFLASSENK